jgi:peptidyl-prolyl cis-trans isomerase B (cyclophilin B)
MTPALLPVALLALAGEPKVTVETPDYFVAGTPFRVRLVIAAPPDGAELPGWALTPAGFSKDGKPLAERGKEDPLVLATGEKKTVEVELAPLLAVEGDFELAWNELPPTKVRLLELAPEVDFLDAAATPAEELARYWVLLTTNRGQMLAEFWPDVAPNHVRNFLDLVQTGFYDQTTFHRVIEGFVIQGGDPDGTGSGSGPRRLSVETSDRKHVPGVLSMARGEAPDSASSQFFVMHGRAPHLDGNYSAFGQLVSGLATVNRIARSPTGQLNRPLDPQVIERALVVKAPPDPAAWRKTE